MPVVPAPSGLPGPDDRCVPLPPAMAAALRGQRERVVALRAAIRSAGLEPAAQESLQQCVEGAFKHWLVASGNVRQVADLVRMQGTTQQEAEAMQSRGGTQRVIMGVMSPSLSGPPGARADVA